MRPFNHFLAALAAAFALTSVCSATPIKPTKNAPGEVLYTFTDAGGPDPTLDFTFVLPGLMPTDSENLDVPCFNDGVSLGPCHVFTNASTTPYSPTTDDEIDTYYADYASPYNVPDDFLLFPEGSLSRFGTSYSVEWDFDYHGLIIPESVAGIELVVSPVTPEPSSVVLLGTGLLAVAGAYRRRLFA